MAASRSRARTRKAASASRDVASNERDVIGLQVVGMGRRASEATREWFALVALRPTAAAPAAVGAALEGIC
jgi:hypothetical protein